MPSTGILTENPIFPLTRSPVYLLIFATTNHSILTAMEKLYYPARIWLAFGEAVTGNTEIVEWLMKNGYPEVAALAHAVRGSEEATAWLFMNKFFHLAALDAAIDENVQAYRWLQANKHPLLAVFADACRGKQAAISWLNENNLEAFVMIARKIKYLRDNTTFDYHKKKF